MVIAYIHSQFSCSRSRAARRLPSTSSSEPLRTQTGIRARRTRARGRRLRGPSRVPEYGNRGRCTLCVVLAALFRLRGRHDRGGLFQARLGRLKVRVRCGLLYIPIPGRPKDPRPRSLIRRLPILQRPRAHTRAVPRRRGRRGGRGPLQDAHGLLERAGRGPAGGDQHLWHGRFGVSVYQT